MFDLQNALSQPGFLINVCNGQIADSNGSFEKLRCAQNEPDIELLVQRIITKMGDMEAIAFSIMLPVNAGVVQTMVRCQYVDHQKLQVLVYLDLETENILMPMDYYTMASVIPCGVIVIDIADKAYHAKYVNAGLLKMLGYTREECGALFQHNVLSFIYHDDLQPGLVKYHEQMKSNGRFYITGRMIRKDGIPLWVNFFGKMATASDGKQYIFAAITDISESIELIGRLSQEKQAIYALQHVTHNIVFRYRFQTDTISFAGELLKKLTGQDACIYSMSEFCSGKSILKMDTKQIKAAVATIKKGIRKDYTFRTVDPEGHIHWLAADFDFIRDSESTAVEIVGKVEDITEKRAAKAYYDKALSLWYTKIDNCEAAITMNITERQVVGGFSRFIVQKQLVTMTTDEYWDSITPHILNKQERRRLKEQMTIKRLTAAFEEKKTRFSYDFEFELDDSHQWFRLTVSVMQNPQTDDLMALLKWTNINNSVLREQIDKLLFLDTYDFICLIFPKSDSYMMVMNMENNRIIPNSICNGYEKLIRRIIEMYALAEDAQYLQFCFSLRNLKNQLEVNKTYSFIGHGQYPDGSPAVKHHTFQYLDEGRQAVLYTRKDITNKADVLAFKSKNKIVSLPFNEVIYIESFGKKSRIITESQQYDVNEMLSSLQERLPGRKFYRCHRCYIVRSNAITSIEQNTAILNNGSRVPISRSNLSILRKRKNDDGAN